MYNTEKQAISIVYLRDMPVALLSMINTVPDMSYNKDGVLQGPGHRCPRITITLKKNQKDADKRIITKLDKLLAELSHNNQIVSYTILEYV